MTITPAVCRRLLEQTRSDLDAALTLLEPSLDLIHDSLNGHPKAARYDRDGGRTQLWCWYHERDHSVCEMEASACGGTPIGGHDPTGDAATQPDPAAHARRNIERHTRALHQTAQTLLAELARWQPASSDMQHPDSRSATAPDGWCTSCWRPPVSQHQPVSRRRDGTPYYAGLCKWCGDFKATYARLPPTAVLVHRHSGRNVTQNLIDRHLRRTA